MEIINLNGVWGCKLPDAPEQNVIVPGCFDSYTERKDIGGVVAFTRSFVLEPLDGTRYFLRFGAVSYYCDIFVNRQLAGSHEGMWDSFLVEVTDCLRSGVNELRAEVIKPGYHETDRFPVRRVLSGFIPDVLHTFGGLWGDVRLEAHKTLIAEHHQMRADECGRFSLSLFMHILRDNSEMEIEACILAPDGSPVWSSCQTEIMNTGQCRHQINGLLDDPLIWGTQAPNIYTYRCTLRCGAETLTLTGSFGFRTVSAAGQSLLLNGSPLYLRGALHWGFYEDEVIPRPNHAQIRAEIDAIQAYGFNAIKHCLYIPSKDYLDEADRSGVLIWVELPLWQQEKTAELPERVRREYPKILRSLAGHPSVVIISLGCELDNIIEADLLEEMYFLTKKETDALVRDNSGSGECYDGLAVEFADFFDYHFYGELHNMEQLIETFTPAWRNTKPWLFGEFCDSDTLRALNLIRKRRGVAKLRWENGDPSINPLIAPVLKKEFYACYHDECVAAYGIVDNYPRLQELSLAHSHAHRKVTLEQTRAFPEISGYNVTVLRDTPLCSNGMLDDFGCPKYDVVRFRESNDSVVLVPAWDLTRIWIGADRVMYKERYNFTGGSEYSLHILLSNYGERDISSVTAKWQLSERGAELLSGVLSCAGAACGEVREICCVRFKLPCAGSPKTCALRVTAMYEGGEVSNEWPVFIYPEPLIIRNPAGLYDPSGLFDGIDTFCEIVGLNDGAAIDAGLRAVLTSRLTPEVETYVRSGGWALLAQRGKGILPTVSVPFWREGMVCRDFTSFWNQLPHSHWADDLRFFSVAPDTAFDINGCAAFGGVQPIVRRYDCRSWIATDYMCEITMGKGTLLATTMRLDGGMGKQPQSLGHNCLGRWIVEQFLLHSSHPDN